MNCHEFQSQLDDALDQRLSPDHSSLSGHASSCPECRRLWEDWLLLERAVGEWKNHREPVEVDLTDRVIAAASREGLVVSNGRPVSKAPAVRTVPGGGASPAEPEVPGRGLWPLLVTVALVLLAAFIVFREGPDQIAVNPPEEDEPTEFVRIPDNVPVPDIPLPEEQPDLDHLIADTRSAFRSLTHQAAAQASDLIVFLPDLREDIGLEDKDETQPAEVQDINVGPVPLPDRVNRVFDFLFDQAATEESETI